MTSELDIDLDQFEDFESDDLDLNDSDENDDYLSGMWSGYGFRNQGRTTADVIIAHGMVQSFVNAFARDGEYVVRFNENAKTAGTDMDRRIVVITPAPILDETITPQEAGLVLTGLAVHEICHPRYGRDTFSAAHVAFPRSRVAKTLSNLLDDVRIERRFVAEYPGYAGVFEPLLKYISGGSAPSLSDQLNLAIAAVRFEKWNAWTDPRVIAERDWWKQWAATYAREDSPRRHVDGIRVALAHMVALAQQLREEAAQKASDDAGSAPDDDGEDDDSDQDAPGDSQEGPGDGEADEDDDDAPEQDEAPEGAGDDDALNQDWSPEGDLDYEIMAENENQEDSATSGPGKTDDEAEEPSQGLDPDVETPEETGLSDQDLGSAADRVDSEAGTDPDLASCPSNDTVDSTASDNGASGEELEDLKEEADDMVRDAEGLQDGVDVATHYRGLTHSQWSQRVKRNSVASRFVRDALMRARTGHTEVSRYQKSGRLDDRGLTRVAHRDYRVFQRRRAPGPEKLLIWVMIDCSGSMQAASADAATVATAIADAAQHVRTTRMAVWGWSDSFRRSDYMPGVCRVWYTGQPTSDIAKIADLQQGGTPDSAILNWAWRAIKREARNGERPVILFASDGGGYGDLKMKVDEARGNGVDVYSVAIGEYVSSDYQLEVYGEGNFVEWQGTILKTARPLGKLVGKMVAGRAVR